MARSRTAKADQSLLEAVGSSSGFWYDVVNTLGEGLLLVNPERRIVFLNERAEQVIGRTLEQVRGSVCVDAIRCPQCHCRCRLFEDGHADNLEVVVHGHDGCRRVLRKNARLLRDRRGRVLGGVETFADITEEVRAREESAHNTARLYREKCRLDAFLAALDDGILSVDAKLQVVMCAARTAELLELPDASPIGRPLYDLLGVEADLFGTDAVALEGKTLHVSIPATGGPRPVELQFRRVGFDDDELLVILRPRQKQRLPAASSPHLFHGIVSRSPAMRDIFRLLENAARTDANILIEGESGVGKELVARAIHELSPRHEQPFYAVNCGTFTGSLLLSELFGHERGAFTGALRTTRGKLELAGRGTLFLDEVSEIPIQYQPVLLRVLEERRFERVGGRVPISLNARLIAATNVSLVQAVREHRFRDDLYFRLKVVPIRIPPLRERPEDIALLVEHFANHPAVNLTGRRLRFSPAVLRRFAEHPWPGNVRELRNLVEYLCFVARETVELEHLPSEFGADHPNVPAAQCPPRTGPLDRETVRKALEQAHYRRGDAARLLGIDRSTLWRQMKRLGLR